MRVPQRERQLGLVIGRGSGASGVVNLSAEPDQAQKTDVDVYNGLKPADAPVQLVLDFTDDVAELQAIQNRKVAAA